MDSDNDNDEVDDKSQYFARKNNNSGLHKYEINSFENKKSDQLICVNGTGEGEGDGEGSSDVLYKVNIDVDSSTVRKIEKYTNSGIIADEDSDSFSDNYKEFVRMSSIETEKLLSNVQQLQQQMVSFDEEVNSNNKRPVERRSFNSSHPTEEKEEDVCAKTATATAVGKPSAVQDITNTDLAKDEIMPEYMPIPLPMSMPTSVAMKSNDGNPRDQIVRMRDDRLKCVQPVSVSISGSGSGSGSGSHWNLKHNLMMSLLSPSNVSKSCVSASASASSCKQSSFQASSGWTLKKQFKSVFSSQSVSSTSPTTGDIT